MIKRTMSRKRKTILAKLETYAETIANRNGLNVDEVSHTQKTYAIVFSEPDETPEVKGFRK